MNSSRCPIHFGAGRDFFAVIIALMSMVASGFSITMDEAVRAALANNLDLRAARFEVEKARGRLIQSGLWPNPSLEFAWRTDRLGNNEG
ncbi:MAG TPA: TolC family protein, partial [Terrimicrobiaceae bacterium]